MSSVTQTLHTEQKAETKAPNQSEGKLVLRDGSEKTVTTMEGDSEATLNYLSERAVEEAKAEHPELTEQHTIYPLPEERPDIEQEIAYLQRDFEQMKQAEQARINQHKNGDSQPAKQTDARSKEGQQQQQPSGGQKIVHDNVFSLAGSMSKSLSQPTQKASAREHQRQEKQLQQHEGRIALPGSHMQSTMREQFNLSDNTYDQPDQDREREDDQESSDGQHHGQDQQQKEQKQKRRVCTPSLKASKTTGTREKIPSNRASAPLKSSGSGGAANLGGMQNIYIRFMALMARILGQAEAEAHNLYTRIKGRTDSIDMLTLLIQKINSSNGAIDWNNDAELKQLVDRARELGVDIPAGKYSWSEDEKKLLKENIQMRKDSMEKITQLERTDMQRFLQEASQCHQARSNVLKLLKEVMDTITHNMRPG